MLNAKRRTPNAEYKKPLAVLSVQLSAFTQSFDIIFLPEKNRNSFWILEIALISRNY